MSNMSITKLLFIQTGEQNIHYHRPFDTHVNGNIQTRFNSLLENPKLDITAAGLVNLASDIIHPQSQHNGAVAIPGGWNTQRLRFFMEIENIQDYAGSKRSQIISGFTDRFEISFNGTIDPNTRLYFNNNISIVENLIWTPNGQASRRVVENAGHILHGDPTVTITGAKNVSLRPSDVFSVLGSGALMDNSSMIDCNTVFSNGMQIANRRDEFSPSYLEKTYNSYLAASSTDNAHTNSDVFYRAREYSRPLSLGFDKFIRTLKSNTSLQYSDFVTYEELCAQFMGLDSIAKIIRVGNELKNVSAYNPTAVCHWGGANHETIDANYLLNAVPALMTDLMLMEVNFATTNDTISATPITTIQSFNGFSSKVNMTDHVRAFIVRFEHEYMPYLTRNGTRVVKLMMHLDLLGESYIKIQYDHNHAYEFMASSFCDGFFSPLISNDPTRLQSMAHNFQTLLSNTDTMYGLEANQSIIQTPMQQFPPTRGII